MPTTRSPPACGSPRRRRPGRGASPRSVPAAIYTIPASSPIHYVTYVRIYEATPTRGLRRLHTRLHGHRGVALRHGGLRHRLHLCAVDRQRVVSAAVHLRRGRGAGLQPLCRLHLRLRRRPGHRRLDGAVLGLWRRLLPPGVLGRLLRPRLLRLGQRQRLRPLGQRHLLGHAQLVCRRRRGRHHAHGTYYNSRTGTAGSYYGRPAIQRLDRQRHTRLRPHRLRRGGRLGQRGARQQLQHLHRPALDRLQRVGRKAPAAARSTAPAPPPPGPEGNAHAGGGSSYNAHTGNTNSWASASVGNQHYADVNGNVYHNGNSAAAAGWQQHSSGGWGAASGDTVWADRESQARSSGDSRFGGFSSFGGGGDRFGGGGGGFGGRFGGGAGPLRRRRASGAEFSSNAASSAAIAARWCCIQ